MKRKDQTNNKISMQSIIDQSRKVQPFGIESYTLPSTENLWKKPQFGTANKEKSKTFCQTISEAKKWVPGSPQYPVEIGEWSKQHIEKGVMDKGPKNMYTEQIFKNAQHKEKSSPGVGKYEIERQWKNSSLIVESKTSYVKKDTKYTFPAEDIALKSIIPAPCTYRAIDLERIKRSSIKNTISKTSLPRFKPIEKTMAPSPSSYNTTQVDEFFQKTRQKHKFGTQQRTSFVGKIYQTKNRSPGAGQYKLVEAAYQKLSKSPSPRRRN